MRQNPFRTLPAVAAVALAIAAADAAGAQGLTQPKQGKGGSVVKGAAGTAGGVGDQGLQHCDKPMGALAVVEAQDLVLASLRRYNLSSPVSLIRLMVQQSNCFVVVERGIGMQNMMQERQLASSGQLRENSNVGGGQMVTADFILTPNVVFAENNAGGVGGAVGSVFGRRHPVVGAAAGGLKFKEAQTSMLVADARSGVQVAAAEGSTRKADLRLGGALFGGGVGAAGGGYGNTNEGKIIAAALMDNYNAIVGVVRNDPSLQRTAPPPQAAPAPREPARADPPREPTRGDAAFQEGDVVGPKIAGVRLLAQPAETARVVATLAKTEEFVVIGAEKAGYVKVQTASASGWVRASLLTRR